MVISKANNGSGNCVERDDWETPQWLFDKLNSQYGFMFDCCAEKHNTKCNIWIKDFLDEFNIIDKMLWMNPPFSKAEAMFRHFCHITTIMNKGIAIYRCDNMETKIWQNIILKHATWILIPKGRISYKGKAGKGSRFPSALIGFNVEPPKELNGTVLFLKK